MMAENPVMAPAGPPGIERDIDSETSYDDPPERCCDCNNKLQRRWPTADTPLASHEQGSQYCCIRLPDAEVTNTVQTNNAQEWHQPIWRWTLQCCFCRIAVLEARINDLEDELNRPRTGRSRPGSGDITDDVMMRDNDVPEVVGNDDMPPLVTELAMLSVNDGVEENYSDADFVFPS